METEIIILTAKYLVALPVVVCAIYVLMIPRATRLRACLVLCVSGIFSYLAALIAGAVYYDPRPFVVGNFTPLIAHAPDNGFPSDHTLLAAVLAFFIFYYNRWLGAALLLVALAVGVSRVVAGVHHVADILGSIIIAGIVVTLVYYLLRPRAQPEQ